MTMITLFIYLRVDTYPTNALPTPLDFQRNQRAQMTFSFSKNDRFESCQLFFTLRVQYKMCWIPSFKTLEPLSFLFCSGRNPPFELFGRKGREGGSAPAVCVWGEVLTPEVCS